MDQLEATFCGGKTARRLLHARRVALRWQGLCPPHADGSLERSFRQLAVVFALRDCEDKKLAENLKWCASGVAYD
eukprot:6209395-Pleurochrysis_carterae.AAC.3